EVEPRSIAPKAPRWLSRPPLRPGRSSAEPPHTPSDLPTNPPPGFGSDVVPKVPRAPAVPQASGMQAVPGAGEGGLSGEQALGLPAPAPAAPLASGTKSLRES